MAWKQDRRRQFERDKNPEYFSGGIGPELYPLTDAEKAAIKARRIGGHAKFQNYSRWTGKPLRRYDNVVAIITTCRECFNPLYDEIGDAICGGCRQKLTEGVS